jgi:hypothetical protein
MLRNGNLSLGFPAPQFFTLYDEIARIAFFHGDETNTSIISLKIEILEITIFLAFSLKSLT